ncbi:MAG: polysaccharide deacetylase family protein [Nitrososphaerota archaeon]|nr:polysaccharide deacetylase family protein [Nitrososphaerota archaeon]
MANNNSRGNRCLILVTFNLLISAFYPLLANNAFSLTRMLARVLVNFIRFVYHSLTVTSLPLPELISNFQWLLSNPIDLTGLRGDIWAWATVPNIKNILHELLLLLERHKVKATFFVSGVCAVQNKAEIIQISDAGHEIGLHGYKHIPYDMPRAEMANDLYHSVLVYKDMGIAVEGFRAPWLITNRDLYNMAQTLGLKYVSNIKAEKPLQKLEGYDFVELPIYLEDQALLKSNAVELLLDSAGPGRVFEFHLLYIRHTLCVLDAFLSKQQTKVLPLVEVAKGKQGTGLSFDIAYLSRWELIKKLVA